MAGAAVAALLEQLDHEEGRLEVLGAEAQVLIEAAHLLVVEVDVEQLSGVDGLRHPMHEGEAGHGLVGELGVDPHHLGVVEGGDKAEHRADGGQVDVGARLVRFGLECEAEVVAPIAGVFAQEVERLAEVPEAAEAGVAGVHFGALAAAPEDVGVGPELDPEVDGVEGLLQRVGAHPSVGTGEGTVLEDGVEEEVGGGHRYHHAVVVERPFEVGHDAVTFGGRGVDGDQVVVVQVYPVGAELAQLLDDVAGCEHGAGGGAEGVVAGVADGPQAEGEAVFLAGCVVGHRFSSGVGFRRNGRPWSVRAGTGRRRSPGCLRAAPGQRTPT